MIRFNRSICTQFLLVVGVRVVSCLMITNPFSVVTSPRNHILGNVKLAATKEEVDDAETTVFTNPSIASKIPRGFHWWTPPCDEFIVDLEQSGGERFVSFEDEDESSSDAETQTNNWLHVTSSIPNRRVEYELRYVKQHLQLAGIVRFGIDCEGPPGHVHGGAMATVADAATATAVFKASNRWGLTTRLDCNYREMMPLDTPVKVLVEVVELKKRKAIVEWCISSLTELDRKGDHVRYSFGSANFLLPRE